MSRSSNHEIPQKNQSHLWRLPPQASSDEEFTPDHSVGSYSAPSYVETDTIGNTYTLQYMVEQHPFHELYHPSPTTNTYLGTPVGNIRSLDKSLTCGGEDFLAPIPSKSFIPAENYLLEHPQIHWVPNDSPDVLSWSHVVPDPSLSSHQIEPQPLIQSFAELSPSVVGYVAMGGERGTLDHESISPKSALPSTTADLLPYEGLPCIQNTLRSTEEYFKAYPHLLDLPTYIAERMMPQEVYRSHSIADHKRYVEGVTLLPPIVFRGKSLEYGISLRDAILSSNLDGLLLDPAVIVLDHGPPSAVIRLQVPGYDTAKNLQGHRIDLRVKTKEKKALRKPISKARFLHSVAYAIQKIFERLATKGPDYQNLSDQSLLWMVGEGPGQIRFEDLYILSIHNVSQGSWQPHLFLDPERRF